MFESAAANLVGQAYWDSLYNDTLLKKKKKSMLKFKAAETAHALYNTI